jgi:hypothetical protein
MRLISTMYDLKLAGISGTKGGNIGKHTVKIRSVETYMCRGINEIRNAYQLKLTW